MRIHLLTTAHNSLSQRLEFQLTERGHEILGPGGGEGARTCAAAHDGALEGGNQHDRWLSRLAAKAADETLDCDDLSHHAVTMLSFG